MTNANTARFFGEEQAAAYDSSFARVAPMRDGLQLTARIAFDAAPADAQALCVGAGTGAEVAVLAEAHPGWRFTVVEPAPAMMALCRQRLAERGFADRCVFHEGYVETVDPAARHDVATALLVSHFILDRDDRRQFYSEIARRLRPQGVLVSADLAADIGSAEGAAQMAFWGKAMRYNGMDDERWETWQRQVAESVALLAPTEIETLLTEAGFEAPTRVYQAALIHGWESRKRP